MLMLLVATIIRLPLWGLLMILRLRLVEWVLRSKWHWLLLRVLLVVNKLVKLVDIVRVAHLSLSLLH